MSDLFGSNVLMGSLEDMTGGTRLNTTSDEPSLDRFQQTPRLKELFSNTDIEATDSLAPISHVNLGTLNSGPGNSEFLVSQVEDLPDFRPDADLSIQLGRIVLPDSIEFGDEGRVKVIVSNPGNTTVEGPLTLNLFISTDDNLDFRNGTLHNDALLQSQVVNVNLDPGESKTFTLTYENLTSVIAPGAYNLIAEVEAPTFTDINSSNNLDSEQVSAKGTNAVVDWNAIALNFIQELGETTGGVAPTFGSRLLAITQGAVFDTVNAFTHTYESYAIDADAPGSASMNAAIAGAASQALIETLSDLFPSQASTINAYFQEQLENYLATQVKDPLVKESIGVAFGQSIASQSVALRDGDGWDNTDPYVPPGDFPGDYVFEVEPGQTALGPKWGEVTPFGISDPDTFGPDGLDGRPNLLLPSSDPANALYIEEIEQVRLIGGAANTAITTLQRTQDQTEIAFFWAYDRADTFRPYGQLFQITEEIVTREGMNTVDSARTFALLGIALADAAITAWDAKYEEVQPRPSVVIGEGFAANDGFEETVADPDWDPLLGVLIDGANNPPFPDYISGHSTFGGAFAGVLSNIFGEDYTFPTVSQELIGVVREQTFANAAFEDAISRVYGGVHVLEASVTDAVPTGTGIGDFVANNLLQPIVG